MKKIDTLHENNLINKHSFIDEYFTGVYKTNIKCVNCDYKNTQKDMFRDIGIDLKCPNILQCIAQSFDKEKIDVNCEKCGTLNLIKQTYIYKYPKILIMHIKRYSSDNFGNITKINNEFSINFGIKIQDNIYELISIIHHHGNSPNKGHYTVDINKNGIWYKLNDNVSHIIDRENIDSRSIYILIYSRL
jgi:ubiquitin C-terminal hydrolase